jgi:UDP-N-acetylglucosamine 2-epimerase
VSVLVGTDPTRIGDALREALAAGKSEIKANPFGDGAAARRTVDALIERFSRS